MLIFFLNLELMSVYLNLSFLWCQQSCGIFKKPEYYMINVLKINCGLIPHEVFMILCREHIDVPLFYFVFSLQLCGDCHGSYLGHHHCNVPTFLSLLSCISTQLYCHADGRCKFLLLLYNTALIKKTNCSQDTTIRNISYTPIFFIH